VAGIVVVVEEEIEAEKQEGPRKLVLKGLERMTQADTAIELAKQERSVAFYIEVVAVHIEANEEAQMG